MTTIVLLTELVIILHCDFDDRKSKGNEDKDLSQKKAKGPMEIGTMPSEIHESICINKCIPKVFHTLIVNVTPWHRRLNVFTNTLSTDLISVNGLVNELK